MPWGRLDDSLYDHPKLDLIPVEERLAAVGLWARAISWCNRFLTDGLIPRDRVTKLDGTTELADRLVAVGLFDATPTGYAVHDFLEFNESRHDVTERRRKEAERKAEYRANRRPSGTTSGTSRSMGADVPQGVPPSVPPSVPVGVPPVVPGVSRARGGPRPVPSRPVPVDTPNPRKRGLRANGESPRQIAAQEQADAEEQRRAKRWRKNQRHLAYLRGAISADDQARMDQEDAPVETIPDWEEYQARLKAEADAPSPLEEAWT